MAKPRVGSWREVKTVARYLMGRKAVVWKFGWQEEVSRSDLYTDSDWGGNRKDRNESKENGKSSCHRTALTNASGPSTGLNDSSLKPA